VRKKILYYSDCAFFAGCENMLVNFWNSAEVRGRFDFCFYYRHSVRYEEGLKRRASLNFPVHPIAFPEPSDILGPSERWPRTIRRMLRFGSRLLFTAPLFLIELLTLRGRFKAEAPDVVHINNGGYPAALSARAAAIAARLAGVPSVIMVVNNMAEGYEDVLRRLEYPIDRAVVASTTRFVTGSSAAAMQLRDVLRLADGKSVHIHNGIKLRTPSETIAETRQRLGIANHRGTIFGMIGLMENRKGHIVLLKAMAELNRLSPELASRAFLIIEGDGPLSSQLRRFTADANLSERCIFTGPEGNVMNLFAAIDVLVLPSISHEDFPNVTIEAMGCGRAVIASRIAGTVEQVIDDETGYLVPPNDTAALAAAIGRFCGDHGLKDRLGARGLQHFNQNFVAEIAVSKYISLYEELAK
jgi:glycosyltransferase involved in cell wall biosynthesis